MKHMKELDYVTMYAEALKKDNALFEQQKMLIESQMAASASLFKNMFGANFKEKARTYLKNTGILKELDK